MKHFILIALCTLFTLPTSADPSVHIYTEHYPPFNYLDENQKIVGEATRNVRMVLDHAGIEHTITLVPWRRAYVRTQQQENTLIYTVTRTPSREDDFHWLVPIAQSNFHVFVRASDLRTYTLQGIRDGLFTSACVKDDLSCELLQTIGMPEENIRKVAKQVTGDFDMVLARRADLYISEISVNTRLREMAGAEIASTKPVLPLGLETGFYLAAGSKTDPDIRARIIRAYHDLVAEGRYKEVEVSPEG